MTRGITPSTVPQLGPALNNIEKFRAETRKRDFARSHRFEVMIIPPANLKGEDGIQGLTQGQRMSAHTTSAGKSAKHLTLMAEDVIIPGLLLGTKALRLNNLSEQRATAIDFGGDSISITFLVDTSWTAKDFFGDWMRGIINKNSREIAYPEKYYGGMEITALDNQDQVVARWILEDAFPRSIAPIQMSSGNTQVVRMSVTFAYKRWFVVWPHQK